MENEKRKIHSQWGGRRPGAGRKKKKDSEKHKRRVFWLTDLEYEIISRYLKDIRGGQ